MIEKIENTKNTKTIFDNFNQEANEIKNFIHKINHHNSQTINTKDKEDFYQINELTEEKILIKINNILKNPNFDVTDFLSNVESQLFEFLIRFVNVTAKKKNIILSLSTIKPIFKNIISFPDFGRKLMKKISKIVLKFSGKNFIDLVTLNETNTNLKENEKIKSDNKIKDKINLRTDCINKCISFVLHYENILSIFSEINFSEYLYTIILSCCYNKEYKIFLIIF